MFLKELLYFIVAAEHLNFSDAAKQLFITKSGLSKNISKIEKELGVQLFMRDKQNVILTPQGQEFYKSACRLLMECNNLKQLSDKSTNPQQEKICIGISSYYGHYAFLLVNDFVSQFIDEDSDAAIEVKCLPISDLQQEYLKGNIDLVLGNYSIVRDLPFCEYYPIWKRFRQIVLPATHPLAKAERLKLSQFKDESFIAVGRYVTPYAYDYDLNLCYEYGGFSPKIVKQVNDFDSLYIVLEHSNMVTISCSLISPDSPSLKSIVIDEIGTNEPGLSLFVGWSKRNNKPAVSIIRGKIECEGQNNHFVLE